VLFQQLQDDGRQHSRHVRADRVRGQRRRGNMVVRPVGLIVLPSSNGRRPVRSSYSTMPRL
jgi:hypothetical protein